MHLSHFWAHWNEKNLENEKEKRKNYNNHFGARTTKVVAGGISRNEVCLSKTNGNDTLFVAGSFRVLSGVKTILKDFAFQSSLSPSFISSGHTDTHTHTHMKTHKKAVSGR